MRLTASIAAVLLLASTASAQTTVVVGAAQDAAGGPFQFMPPNITATNGTVVTFMFTGSPGNHTVAQSTVDQPCQPMSGGFDSGYIFIPPNSTTGFPSWNLTVTNDQQPIYFYCAQLAPVPHCSSGMVGAINAPPDVFASFQQTALGTVPNLPGAPSPNLVGVGASASAPPGPFSGNITGFAVPTGSVAVSSGSPATSGTSDVGSSTSAPATTTSAPASTTTTSAGSMNVANGLVLCFALLLGVALF